ncbi:706_t:CDS:1 [Racocetra fulgida]|uniref:706_t:CDS:1 n=1 Tax=Racocetra fulgida TaxID=60492 RepID=A0A9N9AZD4_9GLOM|nr:706_t:CDS:1 [Racocetra fulgida]
MYFLDKHDAIISQNDEKNYKLNKILHDKKIIKFKRLHIDDLESSTSTVRKLTIKIEEEPHSYTVELDINQSLSEVRKQLLDQYKQNKIGSIRLYKNMHFVSEDGGMISQDAENNFMLNKILYDGKIIKIKRLRSLENIDDSEVIELCQLEYGIKISNDGHVIPHKKALEFIEPCELHVVELLQPTANIYKKDEKIKRETIREIICQKNLITKMNVSPDLPWSSISAGLDVLQRESTQEYVSFDVKLRGRAKVVMTNKVQSTQDFKIAVENALDSNNPIDELKNICDTYGEFWAREVILGGIIVREDIVEISKQAKEKAVDIKYSESNDKKINTKNKETGVKSIYIGGDTDVANKDLEKWDKSLEDYTKWKIVEFRDVVSIFEILDSNLRRRVLGILGERIVYAKVDQRNLTFSNQKPYIHELDVPEKYKGKLDDYKIFASIISEKKGTFFVRVVYKVDSADLLIHQFGKDSRLEYSLKIVWIIIGIPNDFNLFDLKDFNMSELEIKLSGQVSSNKLQEIHDLYDKYDGDTYPIVTCALKDSERDLHDLKIVTGIHFYRTNDNHLNMCVHNYDLENKREIIEKNLSVQYWLVLHYYLYIYYARYT